MPGRGTAGILPTLLAGCLVLAGSAQAAGVWWLDSLAAHRPPPATLADLAPPPRLPAGADEAEALLCRFAPDLPVYVDSTVLRLAAWYGGPDWPRWQGWRRAAQPLVEAAEVECRQRGLPPALALLPLALAGGDPAAGTPLGQAGPWRLDVATARRAGLRVGAWADERRDPARATSAALGRLQELGGPEGDITVQGLAAFTCGSGNLIRAQARGGHDLPSLAARMEPSEREILPLYMAFLLLEALTPEARSWPVPAFAATPSPPDMEVRPAPDEEPPATPRSIQVRRGDTLESLARRHGVRVSHLRRANGITGDRIRAGDWLRLPDPQGPSSSGSAPGTRLTRQQGKTTFRTYTVRPGDTLSAIAARHPGVRVRDIMEANQITDRIQPGQRLRIPLP